MEGWTEGEIKNRNLMAPCGLYCGACGIYIATRDGNEIENFPLATGLRVIKRAIPQWRKNVTAHGDETGSIQWAREECERYHCSACGSPLFRGAQRCRSCKKVVAGELDGSI